MSKGELSLHIPITFLLLLIVRKILKKQEEQVVLLNKTNKINNISTAQFINNDFNEIGSGLFLINYLFATRPKVFRCDIKVDQFC